MNDEITLSEATEYFPKRNGKPVTLATLRYRIKVGCRGVKLDGWLSGGRWFTTREAIDRFHAELNSRAGVNAKAIRQVSANRRAQSKAARDYLKGIGIGVKGKTKSRDATKTG